MSALSVSCGSGLAEALLIRIGNLWDLAWAYGDDARQAVEYFAWQRLTDAGVAPTDVQIRDEFVHITLRAPGDEYSMEGAEQEAQRLATALAREPVQLGATSAYLQIFVQLFSVPAAETAYDVQEASLGNASTYTTRTKSTRSAADFRADVSLGTALLDELRAAQLMLAFQPVVLFRKDGLGTYLYSEALLRRSHAARSDVGGCGEAIEALERLGWVSRLDCSVVWTTVRLLENHLEQRLGCNVSAASLNDDAWWDSLLAHLRSNPGIAERLTLEITETSAVNSSIKAKALLDAIRLSGAHVALDDMGSGCSSFEFLAEVQPDVVKIDRSVLLRCRDEGQSPDLLSQMVARCARHKGHVVVEGVERPGDLNLARRAGAHAVQGFLLGAPDAGPGWLRDRPAVVHDSYSSSGSSPPVPRLVGPHAPCRH